MASVAALVKPIAKLMRSRLGWFKVPCSVLDGIPGAESYRRLFQKLSSEEYKEILDLLNAALLIPANARISDASASACFHEDAIAFRVQCDEFPETPETLQCPITEPTYHVAPDGKVRFAGWNISKPQPIGG